MDDGFAREGVLARCNESREVAVIDEECANARRAATAIALAAERARAPQLEQESEAKLLALREREAQQAPLFVYAAGADPLGRRSIEVSAVEPPANDLVIASPRIEVTDLAVVPRPFRDEIERQ